MIALEHRAHNFFLQCRASARCSHLRFPVSHRILVHRRLTTASEVEQPAKAAEGKPYYVTTPIFYVNSSPHVGHLYTIILADILKRWAKLRGDDKATLLTGTDEHGLKIQKAAQKADTDVKSFCDQHALQFKTLCDAANISYDRFIRTTDEDHKEVVRYVWDKLNRFGYIYETTHEGWYCVSDETFYPESQIQKVLDPSTGMTKIVSCETGKEVEWTSETNYHFKLSAFQESLLQHYRENPGAIVPKQRMTSIVKEIESGLKDLSISRPTSRLSWGIRVPDDESQTIYVWLDALFNYLTMTGYPFTDGHDPITIWPPDCQVIGKDIIRFHTIYWPAFLMALNLPLPKRFLSHAHWTMNNEKMSKSAGNGVNPFFAMDRYGIDGVRFYMAYNGGIVDDAMYENGLVAETYNHLLKGGLGNLVQRVFKSKHLNVLEAVQLAGGDHELGKLLNYLSWNQDKLSYQTIYENLKSQYERLGSVRDSADECMREPDPRKAVQAIVELIGDTNRFFHQTAVWKLARSADPEERRLGKFVLFMSAESVRIIAILLQPVMPERMKAALDLMGVRESERTFGHASFGADFTYGSPAVTVDMQAYDGLFPMLLSSN